MKRLYLVIMAICMTALVSCFSPWEGGDGTITIAFSDNSGLSVRSAEFTPFNAAGGTYEIRLIGPGGVELIETVPMGVSAITVRIEVIPGDWTVSVHSIDNNGDLAGIGFAEAPVTVIAGQSSEPVQISMNTAFEASTFNELEQAINSATGFSHAYILISGNIEIGSRLDVTGDITLISDGETAISRGVDFEHQLFEANGGVLILGRSGMSGSIIIDGGGRHATFPLINVSSGGHMEMHNGVTLRGNDSISAGGGVSVGSNATFTMHGGMISGNNTGDPYPGDGGGVFIGTNATFTMHDGTISGNTVRNGNGGGVYVSNGGHFVMYGGTISGNTANGNGNAVYVFAGETALIFGQSREGAIDEDLP